LSCLGANGRRSKCDFHGARVPGRKRGAAIVGLSEVSTGCNTEDRQGRGQMIGHRYRARAAGGANNLRA
jgi:hypothetical protein